MSLFYEGGVQSGVLLALQQSRTVLCFVTDDSEVSKSWEDLLQDDSNLSACLQAKAVALRLVAGSQEAGFLSAYRTFKGVPSILLLGQGGSIRGEFCAEGSDAVTTPKLKDELLKVLEEAQQRGVANEAPVQVAAAASPEPELRAVAATSTPDSAPTATIAPPQTATPSAANPASGIDPTARFRSQSTRDTRQRPAEAPPSAAQHAQQSQRADYIKMQREREQKQRDERERIKQQIKHDREERRAREEQRTQVASQSAVDGTSDSASARTSEIRVQVRSFDGSTLRKTFAPAANITNNLRPWVDSASEQAAPYNLKIIMAPMPNRNIEAAEEEQSLSDLGIRGSCTMVMVPVKGYVESYTGSGPAGLVGSAVSGGYNLVTGTAGAVFGGVRSILGWGVSSNTTADQSRTEATGPDQTLQQPVRIRTLADQRAEEARKDQQFYNGNTLNFQPRKDERKDD